jgi:hypothetical protein
MWPLMKGHAYAGGAFQGLFEALRRGGFLSLGAFSPEATTSHTPLGPSRARVNSYSILPTPIVVHDCSLCANKEA